MIQFFELLESQVVDKTNIKAGSFICCKDSTNMYMVPTSGGKPIKMAETTKFTTESERESLLAPINGKTYYCYDTGKMWIYYRGWTCLNPDINTEFDIEEVSLTSSGTVTVNDSRIKSTSTGNFYPDPSVADLVSNINVSCQNGKAIVTGTTSYTVFGTLKIKN